MDGLAELLGGIIGFVGIEPCHEQFTGRSRVIGCGEHLRGKENHFQQCVDTGWWGGRVCQEPLGRGPILVGQGLTQETVIFGTIVNGPSVFGIGWYALFEWNVRATVGGGRTTLGGLTSPKGIEPRIVRFHHAIQHFAGWSLAQHVPIILTDQGILVHVAVPVVKYIHHHSFFLCPRQWYLSCHDNKRGSSRCCCRHCVSSGKRRIRTPSVTQGQIQKQDCNKHNNGPIGYNRSHSVVVFVSFVGSFQSKIV